MVIEDFKEWLSKNDDGKGIYQRMHRKMTLEKLASKSMSVHLSNMKRIVEMCPEIDFTALDTLAIEDVQVALTERYKEPATLNIHILTLRKWLKVSGQEQLLSAITKVRGRSKRKLREELITEAERNAMIKACAHPRDAAIIALLSDSGCRVGELVKLQVKHIKFNEHGAIVRFPEGKTGPGEDLIVFASSYMRMWLNAHEYGDDPEAPLFYSLRGKYLEPKMKRSERILPENRKLIPLDEDGIRQQIRNIAKKAGIKRRIHPHLFRHTRATELAPHMPESLMNIKFRWSNNSQTARVYSHVNEKDVQTVILKMAGINDAEEEFKAVEPVKCDRCKEINTSLAEYCFKCGYPLSQEAIAKMEAEHAKTSNEIEEMRKEIEQMKYWEAHKDLATLAGNMVYKVHEKEIHALGIKYIKECQAVTEYFPMKFVPGKGFFDETDGLTRYMEAYSMIPEIKEQITAWTIKLFDDLMKKNGEGFSSAVRGQMNKLSTELKSE